MRRPAPASPPAGPRLSTHGADSGSFGQHMHEWWLLWWSNLYLGSSMLVLLCRPGRHWWRIWQVVTAQVYARLRWSLLGFLLIAYILGSVATQITQQTLHGFGLAHFTPSLMVRILLVEVVPLAAALVAAIKLTIPLGAELAMLRHRKHLARLEAAGIDALQTELLPRLLMGVYASIMFAAIGSATVMVTLYLNIYGYTLAGLEVFTHAFGRTMTPLFTFIFAAKAVAFGYIVALIPLTAAFTDPRYGLRRDSELATLARMLALLILVEVLSLIANYY